jgi:hypothetical protein
MGHFQSYKHQQYWTATAEADDKPHEMKFDSQTRVGNVSECTAHIQKERNWSYRGQGRLNGSLHFLIYKTSGANRC